MLPNSRLKLLAPLAAYIPVFIGLYWIHSAWAALLGFHFALISTLLIGKPSIPPNVLLQGNALYILIGCILLGTSAGLTLYFIGPFYSITPSLFKNLSEIGLTSAHWPLFIGYFALVNPWIEEYFWRGYLGDPSKKLLPIDFYFAGYHMLILYGKTSWSGMLISLFALAFIAWTWRQVYRKTNGLLIPTLGHMAADLSILLTVYWMSLS